MDELVPAGGELDGRAGPGAGGAPRCQGNHCEHVSVDMQPTPANMSSYGHIASRL